MNISALRLEQRDVAGGTPNRQRQDSHLRRDAMSERRYVLRATLEDAHMQGLSTERFEERAKTREELAGMIEVVAADEVYITDQLAADALDSLVSWPTEDRP